MSLHHHRFFRGERHALTLALASALVGLSGRAQEPLNSPTPLTRPAPSLSAGQAAVALAAAQRAQELGFASVSAGLYRQLLDAPGADRAAITVALATALLDAGDATAAESALNNFIGLRGAAWHLRAGLAAAQLKKFDIARTEAAATRVDELGAADRAWHFFLQGLIAETGATPAERLRAGDFYKQAQQAAKSDLARGRFQIAEERARMLRFGAVDEAQLRQAQDTAERFRGRPLGYDAVQLVALMQDRLKRHDEAVATLQRALVALPAEERAVADMFRLTLGFIADPARETAGRAALAQLLETGTDRDKQRMALQLLADAAAKNDNARAAFRAELDRLVDAPKPHPVLPSLLLFRAQAALADKTSAGYARAEADARRLLNDLQTSPLRVHAYGVLTTSAWEQRRYRTAADHARKARAELAAATAPDEIAARVKLAVLEAEAWFRAGDAAGDAGDFRNAADAYAAVLREGGALPAREAGEFMFQRVLAEIRAGAPEAAEPLLDEFARDPARQTPSDLENRWQAEWNLARALQVKDEAGVQHAYARVNRLLDSGAAATASLPPELRARMAWLQARLSLDAGEPARTLALVGALATPPAGLEPALRDEIASRGALLKAEANFRRWAMARENKQPAEAQATETAAVDALQKVRDDYPKSDAAVYSYIIEATHYAQLDRAVDAQIRFTKLADEFPDHGYAPYALLQAAAQAERLGQEKNLEEANAIIERLVTKYPASDLVFSARFRQGELARKRNRFDQAQRAYDYLLNAYPQRDDLVLVRLALAECHNAQSAANPAHAERALDLFAEVRDREDNRFVDARVEAGFNLGALHARAGRGAKAVEVWWRDVVQPFLLDPAVATRLGATGQYWMTRTLLEAGAQFEQMQKLDEAKRAWLLILQAKLPGEAPAKARLKRFGLPEAGP
ncbi:MAG: hypothetical protein RLZZ15_3994 [Verrucomicrobiota bacterium]|jgi:TolA-binding protein